ncbi:uncharacterized protein LOC119667291 [Teleopsis dalmanni]|uniref:uncharacterized protein LOC119667291 n=1 Tax=Teleopsis dalmanni TaxID=139649 RepID=UPI0018CDB465|nr:uncharacterized protein LOC119667291 [Teleopsis dalmanni]
MISSKIICALAIISFCCISMSFSLNCYFCVNKNDCQKPKTHQCNQVTANQTRQYIGIHHTNVNQNVTSPYFECWTETINSNSGEFKYKGCTYTNVRGCEYQLQSYHANNLKNYKCNQCSKDKCNFAVRANVNTVTLGAALLLLAVGKYVWNH